MLSEELVIQEKTAEVSFEEITELYHKAYSIWEKKNIFFAAVKQDVAMTIKRLENATCMLAYYEGILCGTITYKVINEKRIHNIASPYIEIEQFAVLPEFSKKGIGTTLLSYVESIARKMGLSAIVLDTAKPAKSLIRYYVRCGFHYIGFVSWTNTNYYSVILYKEINDRINGAWIRYVYQYIWCHIKMTKHGNRRLSILH